MVGAAPRGALGGGATLSVVRRTLPGLLLRTSRDDGGLRIACLRSLLR